MEKYKNVKILVVDDVSTNIIVFCGLLKNTGIEIDKSSNGDDAIEKIKDNKYDMIFLDHMMPEKDGIETFLEMKEKYPDKIKDVPVIMLTANIMDGMREEYIKKGFSGYLGKPINKDLLNELILNSISKEKIDKEEIKNDIESDEDNNKNEFPIINGINWDVVKNNLFEEELIKSTIKDFINLGRSSINNLDNCFNKIIESDKESISEKIKAYRIQVHSMKSSLALIGAVSLSKGAEFLEISALNENIENIKDKNQIFSNEWKRILNDLENSFKDRKNGNENVNYDTVKEYLLLLINASNDEDIDVMDEIAEGLGDYIFKGEIKEIVDNIISSIAEIDYDRTVELAKELGRKL